MRMILNKYHANFNLQMRITLIGEIYLFMS
ncbi:hypothetical protein [Klebsiella phage 05F01]|nr:hypothetical protein [Klebsiella phage 05F01]